jgi:elongation of very long chain fatty acids protein 6
MQTLNKYLPDGFYTAGNLNPTFDWEKQSIAVYDKYAILFGMIAMMYLPTVFGLKQYMENRKPYNLQVPLVCWNFGLAIFSLYGAIVTVPPALGRIQKTGMLAAICDNSCYLHPASGMVLYFNLSKMPEFVDTIFLRLRKKPVIFLHWYHHIVTMIYCWYGNQLGTFFNCSGWYFASMNLTVHAIMYTYYGLAAMGYARAMAKSGLNKVITSIQLAQMVGGIVILFYSTGCEKFDTNGFAAASVMYGSYLLLFGKLFIDKYIYPKPRKKEHIKVKELKEKHKKKIQQFEEEYEMKLRQMKESQALELKNVKQECANMMGGDAKKKNS